MSKSNSDLQIKFLKKKYHLTTKEILALRELFDKSDLNKDKCISIDELTLMLKQLNKCIDNDEMTAFFKKCDKNKDNKIDFEEFIRILVEEELTADENSFLLDAFCFFDLNGDGLITRMEFKKAMRTLGESWTLNQIEDLISLVDSDDDGNISYTEFKKLFKYLKKPKKSSKLNVKS